ncbi:MAG TPA: matrixin family metalloprotease [Lacipirellulaceae bacterium]
MHRISSRRLRPLLLLLVVVRLSDGPAAHAFILGKNLPGGVDTRWTSTATNSTTGAYGNPITLTWSLAPDTSPISGSYGTIGTTSNLISTFDATFGGSPSPAVANDFTQRPWFHLFSDSFNRWNQLGGISFVYEPHDSIMTVGSSSPGLKNQRGDIRIGGTNFDGVSGTLAATLFPNIGDIVIDTADMGFFSENNPQNVNGLAFRNTLMHETGHAFGLEHVISTSNEFLMAPVIDLNFDGPQLDEIRAIQYFYGDPNEKSHNGLGNNTAPNATALGSIAAGGSIDVGSSAVGKDSGANMVVGPNESDFVSVFSTTDSDYYSFSVSGPTKLSAVLTPRGGIFNQTSEFDPNPPTTFNANNRSDLVLTLFGTNGTSQLALVNNTAAGLAEALSGFALPSAGQYYIRVTGTTADAVQLYDLNLSVASALVALAGDYNHDGVVNAADYTIWRDELGRTGSGLAADGNNDNKVDSTDFAIWKSNFGHTSPGSGSGSLDPANVPEPSSASLAVLSLALCLMGGARRRGAACSSQSR